MRRGTTAFPLTPEHTSARLKGTTGGPDTAQKKMNDMENAMTNEDRMAGIERANTYPAGVSRDSITWLIEYARSLSATLPPKTEAVEASDPIKALTAHLLYLTWMADGENEYTSALFHLNEVLAGRYTTSVPNGKVQWLAASPDGSDAR